MLSLHSSILLIIMMKQKSEVSTKVQNFIVFAENQFGNMVKRVRSDNGPEFILHSFYASKGIVHETSCVECPQQNGRMERKHQDILNIGKALLLQSRLPKQYWNYVVQHVVYLINRVPTMALENKSPYECLYYKPPDLLNLKVFGSLYFISTLQQNRHKFDPRARKCVFLGYQSGTKGSVVPETLFTMITFYLIRIRQTTVQLGILLRLVFQLMSYNL